MGAGGGSPPDRAANAARGHLACCPRAHPLQNQAVSLAETPFLHSKASRGDPRFCAGRAQPSRGSGGGSPSLFIAGARGAAGRPTGYFLLLPCSGEARRLGEGRAQPSRWGCGGGSRARPRVIFSFFYLNIREPPPKGKEKRAER